MARKSSKKRRFQRVSVPAGTIGGMSTKTTEPVNLAEEYAYVLKDLSRMAILAGIIVAALIVLSFFL